MMGVPGVDFSFDAGRITPEWCAAQVAKGTLIAVADLWTGAETIPAARQALRYWREAGGRTAAYFAVHDARPAAEHFERARDVAGDEWEHLERVAIDTEVVPTSPETVLAAADAVIAAGQSPIVYTSFGFWTQHARNSGICVHLPLWDASWETDPSLDMPPGRQYGGWSGRMGHQYAKDTILDGVLVDLNVFAAEFLRPQPQPLPSKYRGRAMLDVVWGVAGRLDALESPYAQQLRDAAVAIKETAGWE